MNVTLEAHGKSFDFELPDDDHITRTISRTNQWYERAMLDDIYERHLKGTALDVGACFGTHSVWFSAVCGLKVVALEPNPISYTYLQHNTNKLSVETLPIAAGHRQGAVSSIPHLGNLGATEMKLLSRHETGLPLITIDSLELSDVTLVKIDTEGFELKVLEGARQTILRSKPLIYVESGARKYGDVHRYLLELGYTRFGKFNKTPTYGYEYNPSLVDIEPASDPSQLKLSVAIMAHPARTRFIPYLHEKLGAVQVVWDKRDNRWDTGRRSMLAFDPTATHHLVVQDDAIVCEDFIEAVNKVIEAVPDNPISFYLGRVRPNQEFVDYMLNQAKVTESTWIRMEGPWWGVAVVVPTRFIPDMIKRCDTMTSIDNYDKRMSRYFLEKKIDCYYSVASLVSLIVGSGNPSLVSGRGNSSSRVSFDFIGEDKSALTVEWSNFAVRPSIGAPAKVTP